MLLDWGIHLIDQLMDMIDAPVTAVDAHLLSIYTPEVDDNIRLTLTFGNGTVAFLEMATNCLINSPRWHVSGTEGTLQVDNWNCEGRIMRLKADGAMTWEDDIVYTAAGPTRTMAPPRPWKSCRCRRSRPTGPSIIRTSSMCWSMAQSPWSHTSS